MSEKVLPAPSMDAEGLKCFKEVIAVSRCYLEYGSGGSTVYAANLASPPTVVSVESDLIWCEKVKRSIDSDSSHFYIEHCDIGEVGPWGTPKTLAKIGQFWTYMVQPWNTAMRYKLVPDAVLIDGRFRVASFLYSLVASRLGTTILFDDYLDRPHYHVVERFCELKEAKGRMGMFSASKNFSYAEIAERIAEYSVVSA